MNEPRIIEVVSEGDIILARMQVREFARAKGFNIMDQARISLATSSLAYALGLGSTCHGQIVIDCLSEGGDTGLRVVCTRASAATGDLSERAFGDTRRMVDQLTVETLPSNEAQVTVIKWRDKKNGILVSGSDRRPQAEQVSV